MRRLEIGSDEHAIPEREQATTELGTLNMWNFHTPFVEHSRIEELFSADSREAGSESIGETRPNLAAELPNQILVGRRMTPWRGIVVHIRPTNRSDLTCVVKHVDETPQRVGFYTDVCTYEEQVRRS